jgi:F0F1-type ATP synthase assembly protein I
MPDKYDEMSLEKLQHLRKQKQDALEHKKRVLSTQRRGSRLYQEASKLAAQLISDIRQIDSTIQTKRRKG